MVVFREVDEVNHSRCSLCDKYQVESATLLTIIYNRRHRCGRTSCTYQDTCSIPISVKNTTACILQRCHFDTQI